MKHGVTDLPAFAAESERHGGARLAAANDVPPPSLLAAVITALALRAAPPGRTFCGADRMIGLHHVRSNEL
jgi:hypothetical protein